MAKEKRLIDKEKLLEKLSWLAKNEDQFRQSVIGGVMHTIAVTPTVDAVEVVHGEWVVCGDGEYVPFMCSACGKTTSWYHAQTANYCPNCGAKMDGEAK